MASRGITRRDLLKYAGYGSVAATVAACGGTASTSGGKVAAKGGTVTVGSYQSDPVPLKGMQLVNAAFTKANGGTKVKMNTVDHTTFQDQITSYLDGTPEDVFTWFSGERMRFFASQGLASPIDDAWDRVKHNYSSAFTTSVTGNDGHIYGIPIDYYPWGVFYRKSTFQEHGYQIPEDWDAFKTLAQQMQKDGLTPLLLGDKDGWEAMGIFDFLDLGLNGYDFHIELLTGKHKFTDPRVTKVFTTWAEITPYFNPGVASQTWQDASQLMVEKKAGMMPNGLFITQQFQAAGQEAANDLDFFHWPKMGTKFDSEGALDAPIDIMQMSKKSQTLKQDMGQANAYLDFWGGSKAQLLAYQGGASGTIPTAGDADTSSFPPIFKKAVQAIKQAKKVSQFFDRDSRPDFAGPNGMQSFLFQYLQNPKADPKALQSKMQQFWDSLPPES